MGGTCGGAHTPLHLGMQESNRKSLAGPNGYRLGVSRWGNEIVVFAPNPSRICSGGGLLLLVPHMSGKSSAGPPSTVRVNSSDLQQGSKMARAPSKTYAIYLCISGKWAYEPSYQITVSHRLILERVMAISVITTPPPPPPNDSGDTYRLLTRQLRALSTPRFFSLGKPHHALPLSDHRYPSYRACQFRYAVRGRKAGVGHRSLPSMDSRRECDWERGATPLERKPLGLEPRCL